MFRSRLPYHALSYGGITKADILNFINLATLFVGITKFVND